MSSPADRAHPHYNRRLKGTPAYRFRHYFSLGVVSASVLIGLGFHYIAYKTNLVKAINKNIHANDDEFKNYALFMNQQFRERDPEVIRNSPLYPEDSK